MARIQSRPTDALSYNPNEPRYWEREKLDREMDRVFDVCHGCRLCFNLCPSFPALFQAIDAGGDDVRNLTAPQKQRVVDLCYECKLCEVRCPYTPRDGHEFQLDFPRLMLRARAVRGREHGIKLREKLLGNPDRTGWLGDLMPGLANRSCRSPFQRRIMEKLWDSSRQEAPRICRRNFRDLAPAYRPPPQSRRTQLPSRALPHLLRQLLQPRAPARRCSRCWRKTAARSHALNRIAAGCPRSTVAT
jgi:NAD-dependent dihydropyrimidine dehydrogenase PreA subunit